MRPDEPRSTSETIENLIPALREVSYAVVVTAALAVHAGGYVSPSLLSAVIAGLSHPEVEVRRSAILVLETLGPSDPQAEQAVRSALNDGNHSVRFAAACCLGELAYASPEGIQALRHLADNQDTSLRFAAIRSLSRVGVDRPEVVEVLISALSDAQDSVCELALQGLLRAVPRTRQVYRALVEALEHRLHEVFLPAREVLRTSVYTSEEALECVLKGLQHPHGKIRREIVFYVLGEAGTGPERVVHALWDRLKDEDMNVYTYVPKALAAVGKESPPLVPALLRLMQDRREEGGVRGRAIKTLQYLGRGTPEVIHALIALLHEKGLLFEDAWHLRFAAVKALGKLGKGNPDVVAALLPLLPEDTSTHTVATALAEVESGSAEGAQRQSHPGLDTEDAPNQQVQAFARRLLSAMEERSSSVPKAQHTRKRNRRKPRKRPEDALLTETEPALLAAIKRQQEAIEGCIRLVLEGAEPITENLAHRITQAVRHQMTLVRVIIAKALGLDALPDTTQMHAVLQDQHPDTRPSIVEAVHALVEEEPDKVARVMEGLGQYYWWFALSSFERE